MLVDFCSESDVTSNFWNILTIEMGVKVKDVDLSEAVSDCLAIL